MKGAKRYAITKITDRPLKRLEAVIDARVEILALGDEIAKGVDLLHRLIENQRYNPDTDEGLFVLESEEYYDNYIDAKESLDRLMDTEYFRIEGEMRKANDEAKKLITDLGDRINSEESKVKEFLQDRKHDVKVFSAPRILREEGSIEKERFERDSDNIYSLMEQNIKEMISRQAMEEELPEIPSLDELVERSQ